MIPLAFGRRVFQTGALGVLAAHALVGCAASPPADADAPPPGQGTVMTSEGSPTEGSPAEDSPADDSPADDSRPVPLTAPAPGDYRGTYFVPVSDELLAYALFELEAVRIELRDDGVVLRYDLPALLVGDSRGVSFRGGPNPAGTHYSLEGDDGQATCSAVDGTWTCDEVLSRIELDPAKIERTLAEFPASEARARRAVAEQFAVDPIGVLSFDTSR